VAPNYRSPHREFSVKYFKLLSQMLKLVVFAILAVPSVMATMSPEEIAKALIAEKNTGRLEETFQGLHKEHDDIDSSYALADVAERGHPDIVATCLRAEQDSFPNDKMCVSRLVHNTLLNVSCSTSGDSESFAKVITSFTPTDAKPLASIRDVTLYRRDAVSVLGRVMAESPGLIIETLPSWLMSHRFDRGSRDYTWNQTARVAALQYLASFATESVLEKAVSIVKANEHYKVDYLSGPQIWCCKSQKSIPQDLIDKLGALLELVKARNQLIKGVLQSLLPTVLVELMLDYIPN
jgi:hypothetical protein